MSFGLGLEGYQDSTSKRPSFSNPRGFCTYPGGMSGQAIRSPIETIHAVTYFSEESRHAAATAGLKGFWMGYFGFRAAPMGAVPPGVVVATFANFQAEMVSRAIPDAWGFADPTTLVRARATSAASTLRRLVPTIEVTADAANEDLDSVIAAAVSIGRPLFTANRDLKQFDDPVERLWQNCSTLREHRGDGHVAALAAAGIDGCEAHLLIAADYGWDTEVFFRARGWTVDQQDEARKRLVDRHLLEGEGLTAEGKALRQQVESTTDARASEPFDVALDHAQYTRLVSTLRTASEEIRAGELIPFPNPIGLRPAS